LIGKRWIRGESVIASDLMKNLIVVGGLMLGLGFAIGWVAKPVPGNSAAEVADAPPPRPAPQAEAASPEAGPVLKRKRTERQPVAGKPEEVRIGEEAKKMQEEVSKQIVKQ